MHDLVQLPPIARRLRALIRVHDLTQAEVCRLAGIDAPHLSRILRGRIKPKPTTVALIEAAIKSKPIDPGVMALYSRALGFTPSGPMKQKNRHENPLT